MMIFGNVEEKQDVVLELFGNFEEDQVSLIDSRILKNSI